MTQARISSFFSPASTAAAYEAQLQRDHDEQSITAQQSAMQRTEQQARKRLREQQNTQEKRRPGRPRKEKPSGTISITNTTTFTNSTISFTTSGDISIGKSANAGARQSLHIAQLLQEQTEEEALKLYPFPAGSSLKRRPHIDGGVQVGEK
jgi:hypothetical protein